MNITKILKEKLKTDPNIKLEDAVKWVLIKYNIKLTDKATISDSVKNIMLYANPVTIARIIYKLRKKL